MSIDALKAIAGFTGGFARPNRFRINVTPPNVNDYSPLLTRDGLDLLCESTSMPGRQVDTLVYPYQLSKQDVKVPNGMINEDVTFNFILTNDYFVKNMFEGWIDRIIHPRDFVLNYAAEYERQIYIHQLDEYNRTVHSIVLNRAWPVTIGAITLDNTTSDEITKLPVTFTYINYIIL